jgi:DNA invertase Pin-like site-specific DNA recombinase
MTKEYADEGISGAKEKRPALDQLLADARRRKFDTLIVWSLDRVGRNLRHLLSVIEELQSVNVSLVSLRDGLDLSSASGRLQVAVLGALSQFEADRLKERTHAGLARARAQGKRLGRRPIEFTPDAILSVSSLPLRAAAKQLGVSVNTLQKARRVYQQTCSDKAANQAETEAVFEASSL